MAASSLSRSPHVLRQNNVTSTDSGIEGSTANSSLIVTGLVGSTEVLQTNSTSTQQPKNPVGEYRAGNRRGEGIPLARLSAPSTQQAEQAEDAKSFQSIELAEDNQSMGYTEQAEDNQSMKSAEKDEAPKPQVDVAEKIRKPYIKCLALRQLFSMNVSRWEMDVPARIVTNNFIHTPNLRENSPAKLEKVSRRLNLTAISTKSECKIPMIKATASLINDQLDASVEDNRASGVAIEKVVVKWADKPISTRNIKRYDRTRSILKGLMEVRAPLFSTSAGLSVAPKTEPGQEPPATPSPSRTASMRSSTSQKRPNLNFPLSTPPPTYASVQEEPEVAEEAEEAGFGMEEGIPRSYEEGFMDGQRQAQAQAQAQSSIVIPAASVVPSVSMLPALSVIPAYITQAPYYDASTLKDIKEIAAEILEKLNSELENPTSTSPYFTPESAKYFRRNGSECVTHFEKHAGDLKQVGLMQTSIAACHEELIEKFKRQEEEPLATMSQYLEEAKGMLKFLGKFSSLLNTQLRYLELQKMNELKITGVSEMTSF